MKVLFYSGLGLSGFSLIQLLSFVGVAYPQARMGAFLLLLAIAGCIFILGLANWIGVHTKGIAMGRSSIAIGFAPAIAIGILFLVAIGCGIYTAVG